jgi:hypothetical protein
VGTSGSDRRLSVHPHLISSQLQSKQSGFLGSCGIEALRSTACQEQWEVTIAPALAGVGSLTGWRAAAVVAHLGSAVGADCLTYYIPQILIPVCSTDSDRDHGPRRRSRLERGLRESSNKTRSSSASFFLL